MATKTYHGTKLNERRIHDDVAEETSWLISGIGKTFEYMKTLDLKAEDITKHARHLKYEEFEGKRRDAVDAVKVANETITEARDEISRFGKEITSLEKYSKTLAGGVKALESKPQPYTKAQTEKLEKKRAELKAAEEKLAEKKETKKAKEDEISKQNDIIKSEKDNATKYETERDKFPKEDPLASLVEKTGSRYKKLSNDIGQEKLDAVIGMLPAVSVLYEGKKIDAEIRELMATPGNLIEETIRKLDQATRQKKDFASWSEDSVRAVIKKLANSNRDFMDAYGEKLAALPEAIESGEAQGRIWHRIDKLYKKNIKVIKDAGSISNEALSAALIKFSAYTALIDVSSKILDAYNNVTAAKASFEDAMKNVPNAFNNYIHRYEPLGSEKAKPASTKGGSKLHQLVQGGNGLEVGGAAAEATASKYASQKWIKETQELLSRHKWASEGLGAELTKQVMSGKVDMEAAMEIWRQLTVAWAAKPGKRMLGKDAPSEDKINAVKLPEEAALMYHMISLALVQKDPVIMNELTREQQAWVGKQKLILSTDYGMPIMAATYGQDKDIMARLDDISERVHRHFATRKHLRVDNNPAPLPTTPTAEPLAKVVATKADQTKAGQATAEAPSETPLPPTEDKNKTDDKDKK